MDFLTNRNSKALVWQHIAFHIIGDHAYDIDHSKNGIKMAQNCVKWNPKRLVLAFSDDDDKGKDKRKRDEDGGVVHLFC